MGFICTRRKRAEQQRDQGHRVQEVMMIRKDNKVKVNEAESQGNAADTKRRKEKRRLKKLSLQFDFVLPYSSSSSRNSFFFPFSETTAQKYRSI